MPIAQKQTYGDKIHKNGRWEKTLCKDSSANPVSREEE